MKRFILTKEPDKSGLVRLEGDDYHYLVRVRRLATGEYFPGLLPGGAEVLVRVRSVEDGVLTGECAAAIDVNTGGLGMLLPPVILLQALPKGDKMDLIVRQAAEGAIAEVVPFVSEFSIPRIKRHNQPEFNRAKSTGGLPEDPQNGAVGKGGPQHIFQYAGKCPETGPPFIMKKESSSESAGFGVSKKIACWERIIKEARQQSGSPVDTVIRPLMSIKGLFAYWEELRRRRPKALGLLFHHVPLAQASLHGYLDSDPEIVALAVGPEGGFSPSEVSRFVDAGFKVLTIGNTILRTETAALYGAAAIRIILLERNSWEIKPRQSGNG